MGITAKPTRMLGLAGVAGLVLLKMPAGSAAAAPSVATAAPGASLSMPHSGTSSFLKGLACSGVACLVLLGMPVGAGAAVPNPGSTSLLRSLACPSPRSCWAVGSYVNGNGAEVNEILRWNGARWSKASAPNPGATTLNGFSTLFSVACAAAGNCWAVGFYVSASGATVSQALRWNGTRWSKASVPSPGGTALNDTSLLTGVRCTSPGNCWAVGSYANASGAELNLALHWNGRKWHLAGTPDPAGTGGAGAHNVLQAVTCTSSANCWAVGDEVNGLGPDLNQALHWNGRKWSLAATPQPGGTGTGALSRLRGVGCASSTDCWAVGYYVNGSGAFLGQALRWGGRKWSLVRAPEPDGTGEGADNRLRSVACTSSADCWAVGSYGSVSGGIGVKLTLALHWNGRKWHLVATPDPAGTADGDNNEMLSVRCTSPADCQAVGDSQAKGGPELNAAMHWNGTKWSTK